MQRNQSKNSQTTRQAAPDPGSPLPDQSALDRLDQAESDLNSLRTELEHSQRLASLGTLAAGIAHEINNVLTPVLAYAQMAANHPNDARLQTKAIQKAVQNIQVATQITQAMLGFAGNPNEPAFACLPDVIQSALDCLGRDPAKDNIKLTINVHPDTGLAIRPLALQQVMMNLILNACNALRGRASGDGGGIIAIAATDQSNGNTCITIADSGPGIPADIAGRLFEPFATSGPSSRQKPGTKSSHGTGLGLAICRRLVEEAGGTISASSASGNGTVFTIHLPTKRAQRAKAS